MPSLISLVEKESEDVHAPMESGRETPGKTVSVKSKVTPDSSNVLSGRETPDKTVSTKSKVTPNSSNEPIDKKRKKTSKNLPLTTEKDSKKQTTLASFFKSPVARTAGKKSQPKTTKAASQLNSSIKSKISIEPILMKPSKIPKPDPMIGNKESLREIVVGSVSDSLMSLEDSSPEYKKCTSVPLNLAISRFNETSRERFLAKLNKAKSKPPAKANTVSATESTTSSDKCENAIQSETISKNKEKMQGGEPTVIKTAIQDVIMEDDDEKTVNGGDDIDQKLGDDIEEEVMQHSSPSAEVDDELVGQSLVQPSMTHVSSSVQDNEKRTSSNRKGDIEEEVMNCEVEMTQTEDKAVGIIIPMTQVDEEDCAMQETNEQIKLLWEKNSSPQAIKKGSAQFKTAIVANDNTACLEQNSAEVVPTVLGDETDKGVSLHKDGKNAPITSKDEATETSPNKASSATTSNKLSRTNEKTVPSTFEVEVVDMTAPTSEEKASSVSKQKTNEKSVSAKPQAEVVKTTSPERLALVDKNSILRSKSNKRLQNLIDRVSCGIEEEKQFEMPNQSLFPAEEFKEELSPQAVTKLACIVQESDLTLSEISKKAFDELKPQYDNVTLDSISDNIKMYFTREHYLKCSSSEMKTLNKLQDSSNRIWRWEIISVELLPDIIIPKVKKARAARKKIGAHSRAIINLLKAVDDVEKALLDSSIKMGECEKKMSKINVAEESVLKQERLAEKIRLMEETKRKKEEARKQKVFDQQKEKKLKEEEAARKKEEKKEEAARKKEDADRRKAAEKQRKQKIDEEKRKKEADQKATDLKKNKSRMMGFFNAKPTSVPKEIKNSTKENSAQAPSDNESRLWGSINSRDDDHQTALFGQLSTRAKRSRKRHTALVPLSVFVTVTSSDPFSDQRPYAEERIIHFRNKYKFLSFFEDLRPAYYGTWSKKSSTITGKDPFCQDKEQLNYDDDSEGEWEEGDDELGEDLNDEAGDLEEDIMDEDEGDTRIYNYQDGWMAEDDYLVYENEEIDEETKKLRKRNKNNELNLTEEIVAPYMGGKPLLDVLQRDNTVDISSFVYLNADEKVQDPMERELLSSEAEVLCTEDVCLDVFPPGLISENFVGDPSQIGAVAEKTKTNGSQEITVDNLKIFAAFVHHSSLSSKDSLVEELRNKHPEVTSSRAQATRKLDSIALKIKNPAGQGFIWEVKRQTLEDLGLTEQLAMKLPEPPKKEEAPKKKEGAKAGSKASLKTSSTKKTAKGKTGSDNTPPGEKESAKKEGATGVKRKLPKISQASVTLFKNFLSNKKAKQS